MEQTAEASQKDKVYAAINLIQLCLDDLELMASEAEETGDWNFDGSLKDMANTMLNALADIKIAGISTSLQSSGSNGQ